MRKILIVAYYFPPIGGIGSIRMAKFVEYLPEFGWKPTVLAPRDTPHPEDPRLVVDEDHVVRSRSIELSRLGRVLPRANAGERSDAAAAAPTPRRGSFRDFARRHANRFVFYPDAQIGWYPDAVRQGRRILSTSTFDAIFSSSYPLTAHLVARSLHRQSGVPWVAEFRDPWSDRLAANHPFVRHARRLERAIAAEAARVILPSPSWGTLLSTRWRRPVDVIPNGQDVEGVGSRAPGQPTVTYLGTYYPERQDLRAVWAAIRKVRQKHRAIRVRFVGELPPALATELAEFGLDDVVDATGFLPHDAATAEMLSSSVLIASGFPDADPLSRGVIPAKIFEYLATSLPILYSGDPADDTWRLLENEPGCWLIEPDDIEGACRAIEEGLASPYCERNAEAYSRRARTRALAAVLAEAVGTRSERG